MYLYVKLTGRLGNHLFQIATGYALSKKHNCELILVYTPDTPEQSYLGYFKFKNVPVNFLFGQNIKIFNFKPRCFEYIDIPIKEDTYLDGYFQNEKYFKNYYQELYDMFIDKTKLKQNNSYFIHYRRGDYVNHHLYIIDYDTYFKKAIKYILDKDPDAYFNILSDDIEYCKTYKPFEDINKTFIENLDTLDTLHFMTCCEKGAICSNSSFSWWGSYLNKNKNKIVIFPREWINNGMEVDIWFEKSIVI